MPGDIVAEVVVVDDPFPMNLPPEPLPVTPFLAPITDEELAANGGLKRTIVMRVIAATRRAPARIRCRSPAPRRRRSCSRRRRDRRIGSTRHAAPTQIAEQGVRARLGGTTSSPNPGMPTTYIPFQSTKALTQMVALNAVEEWTIVNMNNIRHPFHIHVNPMYIVAINGKRLAEPYWADTMPLPFNDNPPPPERRHARRRR